MKQAGSMGKPSPVYVSKSSNFFSVSKTVVESVVLRASAHFWF
jgi:hypothetical protein